MIRYNAIIKPLKPRLSKFKTMGIAAIIWSLGENKTHLKTNHDLHFPTFWTGGMLMLEI